MKKILFLLSIIGLFLTGCNEEALDPKVCLQEAKKVFPGCSFYAMPDKKFSWLVKKNDSTFYLVKSYGYSSPQITSVEVLISK